MLPILVVALAVRFGLFIWRRCTGTTPGQPHSATHLSIMTALASYPFVVFMAQQTYGFSPMNALTSAFITAIVTFPFVLMVPGVLSYRSELAVGHAPSPHRRYISFCMVLAVEFGVIVLLVAGLGDFS